ncbi:MAG: RNA-directed DNA polymerase [Saprospiraceae bacterium]
MKRSSNLIAHIAEPENLRLAYWKARKGKTWSQEVAAYRTGLEPNLCALREQILTGRVQVGSYRYFKVYDPKERQICASAFSEQVLHHALMNICHDYYERAQVFDSYASRPGKGVHAALKRAASFNRPARWFLKLDVRKFFESIHHDTLKAQLERMFKDYRLLDIFGKIIDSYEAHSGRGVSIGNLSSQYFANHYLSSLDHFIKERLQCKAYVRYMDDMVLWHPEKEWLKNAHNAIEDFVETRLQLHLKPELLNRTKRGLPFCGYLVFPHHIRLSQRSKKRYIKKLKYMVTQHQSGEWDETACQRHALPLVAFTRHADTLAFRKNVLFTTCKDEEHATS